MRRLARDVENTAVIGERIEAQMGCTYVFAICAIDREEIIFADPRPVFEKMTIAAPVVEADHLRILHNVTRVSKGRCGDRKGPCISTAA